MIAAQTALQSLGSPRSGRSGVAGFRRGAFGNCKFMGGKERLWSVSLYTVLELAAMATSQVQWDTFFPLHRWLSSLLVLVA